MFSPVWFPVPPDRYGGIEAMVSLLADGLVQRGADVTLFASGDSVTRAKHVFVFERAPSERIGQTYWELNHALACLTRLDDYDVVHDHSGLLGLTLFGLTSTPVLHTVHGPLTGEAGDMYQASCSVTDGLGLVSLTRAQRRPLPELPWVANVPNAVDLSQFPYSRIPGEYLLFLGRMSPEKGAHRAIEVARQTGRPLLMAAKCRESGERAYFDRYIRPHLSEHITYVGEVAHEEKWRLLSGAHALLVPIDWEEPFGLVMIEALACGTPVIALRRGSVPEVLDHGRTGFIADDLSEMAAAVEEVWSLDPRELRAEVEQRFTPRQMVEGYLDAYDVLLESNSIRVPVLQATTEAAPLTVAAAS
jgi:glycosyltransferase involved in cell wall biosynthesis